MGARFEGGTGTEDCGHGLRMDSNRGNFGAMISLQREERRCSMTIMTITERTVDLPYRM